MWFFQIKSDSPCCYNSCDRDWSCKVTQEWDYHYQCISSVQWYASVSLHSFDLHCLTSILLIMYNGIIGLWSKHYNYSTLYTDDTEVSYSWYIHTFCLLQWAIIGASQHWKDAFLLFFSLAFYILVIFWIFFISLFTLWPWWDCVSAVCLFCAIMWFTGWMDSEWCMYAQCLNLLLTDLIITNMKSLTRWWENLHPC